MGHERVGSLPRTRKWRRIVADLYGTSVAHQDISATAKETLSGVRSRLEVIEQDSGVQAAFQFLVCLPAAATQRQSEGLPCNLDNNPSALRLVIELNRWVNSHDGSLEYRTIAQQAAADSIAVWTAMHKQQRDLFSGGQTAREIWSKADSGAGFSEVARLFFANFTNRYLNYFLEREASATTPTIADRERLATKLSKHIDAVSKHSFETAKITQSFAAGWYNKHARNKLPSRREIKGFLSVAFGKIREELLREGRD